MRPDLAAVGVLLSVLAAGCISSEIEMGNPGEYEFPGLNNTTIYYLNITYVQVIEGITNATSVNLLIGENGEVNFKNPVAVDYSGNNVTFNVTKGVIFGKSYARFDFNAPFSGFVAFTLQDDQDFNRPLTGNGSVRVVLPAGYTTGSRFLGIAQPEPDNITVDRKGRDVLIWNSPYPEYRSISVRYYQRSAPTVLLYFFIFLSICIIAVAGYFYVTLRMLQKKRELMERHIRRK